VNGWNGSGDVDYSYSNGLGLPRQTGRIKYTKPLVRFEDGKPPFKTQRLLGSRALVSDTYSKWRDTETYEPGYGQYHHREGYNLLYGDWSAKWYGDPQQRFMFWPKPVPGGYGDYAICSLMFPGYVDIVDVEDINGFDTAHGIDVE